MYGKYFASTFTGSMVGAGPDVHSVWGYVIAHAVMGRVELNPTLVAASIGKMTPRRVKAAIEYLCAPDPNSRNPAEEGRRLLFEGGFAYHVVSHKIYKEIRNEDERREYNAQKQREYREKKKQGTSALVNTQLPQSLTVNDMCTLSAKAEADTEAEAEEDRACGDGCLGERDLDASGSVTPSDVLHAWQAAVNGAGGCPGAMHAEHAWRRDYEAIAAAINTLPSTERGTALRAVVAWFWRAPDGPIRSGRIKRAVANPGLLCKRITSDLHAAAEWWRAQPAEAAQ